MTSSIKGVAQNFGLDYVLAKMLCSQLGNKAVVHPDELVPVIQAARQAGLLEPGVNRQALFEFLLQNLAQTTGRRLVGEDVTARAEKVIARRRKGWPIPNTP